MNLRDIKKDIEYFVGAFVDDCALFLNVNPGKQTEKITDLIDKAVDLYNDLKKAYFDNLRKEMLTKLDGLYEELSAAVKEGVEK